MPPESLFIAHYLKKIHMEHTGTWGTDIEIIALATLLLI
jgi:hypothetical protein